MTDLPPFGHAHTHTEYSPMDGESLCEEIAARAVADGNTHCAITDHGNTAGHPEFQRVMDAAGVIPVFGIEAYFAKDRLARAASGDKDAQARLRSKSHLVLLARTQQGLRNLWTLSTESYVSGYYHKPTIDWELLEKYGDGLAVTTACLGGPISKQLLAGRFEEAAAILSRLRGIFGEHLYLEVQANGVADQYRLNRLLKAVSGSSGVPLLAASDSHFPGPGQRQLHKAWMACQTGTGREDYWQMEHMQTAEEVYRGLAPQIGDEAAIAAIGNAGTLLAGCEARIGGQSAPPVFLGSADEDARRLRQALPVLLDRLARDGRMRFPRAGYEARLEEEFALVADKKLAGCYLMVEDITTWAGREGILVGPGRGSAAGSLMSYLLGITVSDPLDAGLMFSRFLTPGRTALPDFDLDFPSSQRARIQNYVIAKYGEANVVRVGTHMRYRSKSILDKLFSIRKDFLPPDAQDDYRQIASVIDEAESHTAGLGLPWDDLMTQLAEDLAPYVERYQEIFATAAQLVGRLRSYGKHPAGLVISTSAPLAGTIPMRTPSPDDHSLVSQWDFRDMEAQGLLKIDFLTLRTLDSIQEAITLIEKRTGFRPDPRSWTTEYCVAPETRVCTADLRWVHAGDVCVGDKLVGFDEFNDGIYGSLNINGKQTKLRSATVESVDRVLNECYLVTTEDGRQVIASSEHRWVEIGTVRKGGDPRSVSSDSPNRRQSTSRKWTMTKDLVPGKSFLCWWVKPWNDISPDMAYESGWLAGFADGEACLMKGKTGSFRGIGLAQNPGPVWDRVKEICQKFDYKMLKEHKGSSSNCMSGYLNYDSSLRLLGQCRPARLLGNYASAWEGRQTHGPGTVATKVTSVVYLGKRETVALRTSTKTFIAEGFLSHNCDPQVWEDIGTGRTAGMFQIETSLGRQYCKAMKPLSVAELAHLIALVRPGPRNSGMDQSYLRRRRGEEEVTCPHPLLEESLRKQQGIMIFQEDILRACTELGGYDGAEADKVRKILGKKLTEKIAAAGRQFADRCEANGKISREDAEKLWSQMETFGKYGFNASHAFSYSVLAFWTGWLKAHYPAETLAGICTTLSDKDKDRIPVYVTEARRLGITVLPPDVNHHARGFAVEWPSIRYGLDAIKGVGGAALAALERGAPFASAEAVSSSVNAGIYRSLAVTGALDSLVPSRRALVEHIDSGRAGDHTRCVHRDDSVSPLPCGFDWKSEPPIVRISEKTGLYLKPVYKAPPARCTRACRQYQPPKPQELSAALRYDPGMLWRLETETYGTWLSTDAFERLDELLPGSRQLAREVGAVWDALPAGFYQIAGILAGVQVRRTRAGTRMAWLSVAHELGFFDIAVFRPRSPGDGPDFTAALPHLPPGTPVAVSAERQQYQSPRGWRMSARLHDIRSLA